MIQGYAEPSPDVPEREDIGRAWLYHAAIDTLLHTRVQAFLAAQSFLILPLALGFTIDVTNALANLLNIFVLLVIIIGFVTSLLLAIMSGELIGRLNRLKNDFLRYDNVYLSFHFPMKYRSITTENRPDKITKWHSFILPIGLPSFIVVFWIGMFVLWLLGAWTR